MDIIRAVPNADTTRLQARSKDQAIKRREVELDLQVSPEEIGRDE